MFYKYAEFASKLAKDAKSNTYSLSSVDAEYRDIMIELINIVKRDDLTFNDILGVLSMLCVNNSKYTDFFNKCVSRY